MQKKNLLFIGHSSAKSGGAEDDFSRLLHYFHSQNDMFRIYGIFPSGVRSQEFAKFCDQYWNVEFGWFPLGNASIREYLGYFRKMFGEYKALRKVFKEVHFDVCLINVSVLLTPILISKRSKIKTIVFIRENIRNNVIRKIYQKFISKRAVFFYSVSKHIKEEFFQNTGCNKTDVIYSSIEQFAGDTRLDSVDIESKLGGQNFRDLSETKYFKILQNASFVEIKNQLLLLKSLKKIIDSGSNVDYKLFFLGSYDPNDLYFSSIQKYINENHLSEYCIFLGVQEKNVVYEIYRLIDVVVLTSFSEGLPLVMVESLKMKKPFISTNIQGVNEIIIDKQNGLLIDFNENQLANAIKLIATNPELTAKITNAGYDTFMKYFNLEENLLKVEYSVRNLTDNLQP